MLNSRFSERLVTVVIPAFNAQETLAETLDSVLAQTHPRLEIFVIDDGSTDGTATVAEEVARRDSRVNLIRQVNSGVAAARNAGLARASASHVAWLDADDLWHPTKIERQLAVFQSATEPLGFVYTGYRLIDSKSIVIPNFRTLADISGRTLHRQIATTFFTNVSSFMAPVALARECGGHETLLRKWGIEGAEDLLLQLRLSLRAPVGCVREALVGYRMHGANMSRGIRRASQSNSRVLDLIGAEAPFLPDWVLRLGRARMVGFAFQMMQAGDVAGGIAFLSHALASQPLETTRMLARIAVWVFREALGLRPSDRCVGRPFGMCDPTTVPWEGHMMLADREAERLDELSRTTPYLYPKDPASHGKEMSDVLERVISARCQ